MCRIMYGRMDKKIFNKNNLQQVIVQDFVQDIDMSFAIC